MKSDYAYMLSSPIFYRYKHGACFHEGCGGRVTFADGAWSLCITLNQYAYYKAGRFSIEGDVRNRLTCDRCYIVGPGIDIRG